MACQPAPSEGAERRSSSMILACSCWPMLPGCGRCIELFICGLPWPGMPPGIILACSMTTGSDRRRTVERSLLGPTLAGWRARANVWGHPARRVECGGGRNGVCRAGVEGCVAIAGKQSRAGGRSSVSHATKSSARQRGGARRRRAEMTSSREWATFCGKARNIERRRVAAGCSAEEVSLGRRRFQGGGVVRWWRRWKSSNRW